ncbi:MarR family transcriptional regulator [Amycolatopsis decaplanina DSM 44594]|uniref:MarR family transcriptional regulator n=1 Tax=Amycolatopsis decaplanina DSM 44594 TaxID=1284240 RepID=M2ZQU5_9PSEU|nr:MarR family winged helix-turn-helix transcriptional regulator [Amycolatopsis decaplanina]EME62714.1 MarR family transcriptional regulator [Amycolatopsis decaplanina DSM 44594]
MANQRELAAAIGVQVATLTHHLNATESVGSITRRRAPDNPRVQVVELTGEGETVFHRPAKAAIAQDKRIRAGFSDEEITTLAAPLSRLAANVTAVGIDQENSDWTHPNGDSGQD